MAWAALMLWVAVALVLTPPAWSQSPLAVPPLTARVIDKTTTLSDGQVEQMESRLREFEASHGTQIVVLMVPTVAPEDIAAFANRVADTWKIGRKDVGDGLLLVIAKNDRKIRIEVARSLEGAVPDLAARQVIDQSIAPGFKQGDFAGGINAGLDHIFRLVLNEALPQPEAPGNLESTVGELVQLMLFVLLLTGMVFSGFAGLKRGVNAALTFSGAGAAGAAVGGLAWQSADAAMTGYGLGLVGYLVVMFFIAVRAGASASGAKSYTLHTPVTTSSDWDFSSSSSANSSSSSSGSDFSSGSGGSFGGGGASGEW